MKRLYHWSLDAPARTVRLSLMEKRLPVESVVTLPWAPHPDIARLAPGASAPALTDQTGEGRVVAVGSQPILEHLEEAYPTPRLLPASLPDRAEARRLWRWVEDQFFGINATLLAERVAQWVRRDREPDSAALRQGAHALRGRLTFLNALAEARTYLAGRHLTLADFSAAAHLSCLDYFGDVDWSTVPDLKTWYQRMKSRASFQPLLAERIDGTRPAAHYADLEF